MSEARSINVLVTGANGFIGSHLAECLLRKGRHVRCLVRRTSDLRWLQGLDVQLIHGSLEDPDSLAAAVTGCDYIYHIAGAVKAKRPSDFYRYNTEGTVHLAAIAGKLCPGLKRFLFSSSQAAAGPSPVLEHPRCETDQCRPLSDYGRSKLQAEQALAMSPGLPATVIRPPSVYGPRDTEIFMYFQWINRGLALLPGLSTRYAHLVYVTDLVEGMIAAAESPNTIGKTYFLAEGREYSWQDISDLIARSLGKRPLKIHVPIFLAGFSAILSEAGALVTRTPTQFTWQKVREMAQRYWTVSSRAARDDFGFACTHPLAEGIDETARWYKEQGWL